MLPLANVKMKTDGSITKITINGQDFSGATGVMFLHNEHTSPVIRIEMPVETLELEGEVQVEKENRPKEKGAAYKIIGSACYRKWDTPQ